MNNRKKFTSLLLAVLLACSLFAGCSTKNDHTTGFDNTIWDMSSAEPEYLTEWPENTFTEKIVQPQSGTIDYVLDYTASGRYAIFVKDISAEETNEYVKVLKDDGYSEIHTVGNNVSAGTMLEREDAYLSVAYSEGELGVLITLKEQTN